MREKSHLDTIFNVEIYFATSSDIKVTPLFSSIPILKLSKRIDQQSFPYIYHLHILVEPSESSSLLPLLIDASVSFNASIKSKDGTYHSLLHYGKLQSFQLNYQDYFQQYLDEINFEDLWSQTTLIDSIRVLYLSIDQVKD